MSDTLPQKTFPTPVPTHEPEQLAALHRYKILDTPPEAAFDRITRLAAQIFNLPIALISLVDESRTWFKSAIGFETSEVPRDVTLCSFSVLIDEPLIIPDKAAREAAETANRIKNEFSAVLAHERRSPLNPILVWTRLLQSGKLDRQTETLKTIAQLAQKRGETR